MFAVVLRRSFQSSFIFTNIGARVLSLTLIPNCGKQLLKSANVDCLDPPLATFVYRYRGMYIVGMPSRSSKIKTPFQGDHKQFLSEMYLQSHF